MAGFTIEGGRETCEIEADDGVAEGETAVEFDVIAVFVALDREVGGAALGSYVWPHEAQITGPTLEPCAGC